MRSTYITTFVIFRFLSGKDIHISTLFLRLRRTFPSISPADRDRPKPASEWPVICAGPVDSGGFPVSFVDCPGVRPIVTDPPSRPLEVNIAP